MSEAYEAADAYEASKPTEENWEALAHHIILQAVADYRRALRELMNDPDDVEAMSDLHEIEQFFLSEWFCVLTKLDGKRLLTRLKGEIQNSEGNL